MKLTKLDLQFLLQKSETKLMHATSANERLVHQNQTLRWDLKVIQNGNERLTINYWRSLAESLDFTVSLLKAENLDLKSQIPEDADGEV